MSSSILYWKHINWLQKYTCIPYIKGKILHILVQFIDDTVYLNFAKKKLSFPSTKRLVFVGVIFDLE